MFPNNVSTQKDLFQVVDGKADIATAGFACTHQRMEVVNCAPFVAYIPNYFFSRYPRQVSKLWNLLGLFTPAAWLLSFISFISVVLVLKISAVVGTKYFELKTITKEMVLNPFRQSVAKIIF